MWTLKSMGHKLQLAMIAMNEGSFTRRLDESVRIDGNGNKPVGFDKKKLECFKCHNTGHFPRECTTKGTNNGKKRDSFYKYQRARKKEQNQNYLLTIDDGVVNWGEHTVEEEETNHALMAISLNNEQQLSLNEQLTFQANKIYAKDEKLKKYRRIGIKDVKEKKQLQKIVDSWKNSFKNLWKLVDSGMASNSKVGLGYEIQSNNEVLSYVEEMNCTVFKSTEEDFLNKPSNSRFSKTNNFKGVPHPLYGDYTPKPQEENDDSLYVYGKKRPQKPEIKSISVPNEMSTSKSVTTNEKVVSESKEVEPSCATHVKTPRQLMKNQGTPEVKGKNWNKMMEIELREEAELKKQRVFTTGNEVAKPVKKNANRVNRANHFIPRPVQLNTVRQNINSVRPSVNTGRTNVNSVRHNVNSVRINVNTGRSKQPVPTSNTALLLRPQQDHPLKNMEDRGMFNSGCSGHMTGNKDHLDDFEECKGGFVTFGGSKGYITGKGRIRVGNLDFDSVSFVKELGHFNLFSISQICDKHHMVLFTETECLVVSPDFKMPDENQKLIKVLRQHNMYSFDMKIPTLIKDYA
ncbi:ribonuclease H-like domain-containing protein [Tanacetum coccineum]